jgi:1-acyl-sn-glycerol-3-phosphate acyltransferase
MIETAPPPQTAALPRRWHWLTRGFKRYCCRYVRKHFHAVRLSRSSSAIPDGPLLIVLNHPSWWDPLIGVILSGLFERRDHFAAIDAIAVEKYPFFKRLGFVGVRGAGQFLRIGEAILEEANRAFWVTAQGRFTDVRERPLNLRSGVGHLAARLQRGSVLPVALEYCFWNERTPEALIRIGEPLAIAEHPGLDGKQWMKLIEDSLAMTLDGLNTETIGRDPANFTTLLDGRTGVGGMYDRWRRFKSWLHGERFDPSHEAAMKERT